MKKTIIFLDWKWPDELSWNKKKTKNKKQKKKKNYDNKNVSTRFI